LVTADCRTARGASVERVKATMLRTVELLVGLVGPRIDAAIRENLSGASRG